MNKALGNKAKVWLCHKPYLCGKTSLCCPGADQEAQQDSKGHNLFPNFSLALWEGSGSQKHPMPSPYLAQHTSPGAAVLAGVLGLGTKARLHPFQRH